MDTWKTRIRIDDNECWIWTGGKTQNGYGTVRFEGKTWYVHRLSFTLHKGPIPSGLQIDHLCRNRLCCNPDHLEAVTQRENLLRGNTITAKNAAATHCPQGHEYSLENTKVTPQGFRICITCKRKRDNEAFARKTPKSEISGILSPADRTHCPKGHEYTESNTIRRKNGYRVCRTCEGQRQRRGRDCVKSDYPRCP